MQATITSDTSAGRVPLPAARAIARLCFSAFVVVVAFFAAAYIAGAPPFEHRAGAPSERERVLRALPFDAPLPYDVELVEAGPGNDLPYQLTYVSSLPPAAVAEQMAEHLGGAPKWALTQDTQLDGEFRTTLSRIDSTGLLTHFAVVTLQRDGERSLFTFEFVPIAELGPK